MRILYATLALAGLLGSGPRVRAAEVLNGINAIVHDAVITHQAVLEPIDINTLRRQYGSVPDLFEKKFVAAASNNLDRLLERQLILHDFQTAGYNLPEAIIEDEVQSRIRKDYGDRATLTKTLQEEGITYEKFRQQVREQYIVSAMRYKNVSGEIIISPYKIETYYAEHADDYKVEEMVKLRMIFLNKTATNDTQTLKLAEEIRVKIKEGAAFSEMASLYTQGPRGERDWGKTSELKKELATVAASLKPGEVSDPIETPDSCYLMLLEGRRPAHVKPLNEVRDEIEMTLLKVEQNRLAQQWIERLRKKTFVRYFPM